MVNLLWCTSDNCRVGPHRYIAFFHWANLISKTTTAQIALKVLLFKRRLISFARNPKTKMNTRKRKLIITIAFIITLIGVIFSIAIRNIQP